MEKPAIDDDGGDLWRLTMPSPWLPQHKLCTTQKCNFSNKAKFEWPFALNYSLRTTNRRRLQTRSSKDFQSRPPREEVPKRCTARLIPEPFLLGFRFVWSLPARRPPSWSSTIARFRIRLAQLASIAQCVSVPAAGKA